MIGSTTCYVTSQNHGFAVDDRTLGDDWEPLFVNMNDGTNEGIRHKTKPFFSAQFHPEASSGPRDTEFIFDQFLDLVRGK
jgi:carbamoyl-phosphate synthase small subunit